MSECDLVRRVVERDRCCCLCGRTLGLDAWRHSEPSLAGESPANFSAMCLGCIAMMHGRGVAPTRYVVHVREPWARVRRVAADGLAATILLVYGGFAGFVAWIVTHMPREGSWLPELAATVLLMVMFLALIVRGLLDRWRSRAAAAAPSLDPEHVR